MNAVWNQRIEVVLDAVHQPAERRAARRGSAGPVEIGSKSTRAGPVHVLAGLVPVVGLLCALRVLDADEMNAGDVLLHHAVEIGRGEFDARQHLRQREVVEGVVRAGVVDRPDLGREIEREVGVMLRRADLRRASLSRTTWPSRPPSPTRCLSRSVQYPGGRDRGRAAACRGGASSATRGSTRGPCTPAAATRPRGSRLPRGGSPARPDQHHERGEEQQGQEDQAEPGHQAS